MRLFDYAPYYSIRVPCWNGHLPRCLDKNEWPWQHDGVHGQIVGPKSPQALHRAVAQFATYFRREFDYDFVQYTACKESRNPEERAVLWSVAGHMASSFPCVGAAAFVPEDNGYCLNWVWLHPYVRRNGILTAAWPHLQQRFGEFTLELPLSEAMQGFVDKMRSGKGESSNG